MKADGASMSWSFLGTPLINQANKEDRLYSLNIQKQNTPKTTLTGGERAASIIELMPCSGVCNRPINLRTLNARPDRIEGTSRIMLVCTTPGSTALQQSQTQEKLSDSVEQIHNQKEKCENNRCHRLQISPSLLRVLSPSVSFYLTSIFQKIKTYSQLSIPNSFKRNKVHKATTTDFYV